MKVCLAIQIYATIFQQSAPSAQKAVEWIAFALLTMVSVGVLTL